VLLHLFLSAGRGVIFGCLLDRSGAGGGHCVFAGEREVTWDWGGGAAVLRRVTEGFVAVCHWPRWGGGVRAVTGECRRAFVDCVDGLGGVCGGEWGR